MTDSHDSSSPLVSIYTDGGCRGNPGIGAWAGILVTGKARRTIGGAAIYTTNNKMELTGPIEALRLLTRPVKVCVTSDSQYLIKGMTEWMAGWKKRGWTNSQKKPVENKELWQELDRLAQIHEITWEWVRGHAGHPMNEACDVVANELMDRIEQGEPADLVKMDKRIG